MTILFWILTLVYAAAEYGGSEQAFNTWAVSVFFMVVIRELEIIKKAPL